MTEAVREQIARALSTVRKAQSLKTTDVEQALGIGRGWVDVLEGGEVSAPVDLLMSLLKYYGMPPGEFFSGISGSDKAGRDLFAEPSKDGVTVHFRYASHDAKYVVPGATTEQFDAILAKFRELIGVVPADGDEAVVKAVKTNAIAETFLYAVRLWPHINPSDIWWFIVYRAFCDPFNHPADYARGDFGQSWKRSAGWALEEVVVRHYRDHLAANGVRIYIAPGDDKRAIAQSLTGLGRVEADKIDVVLRGIAGGKEHFFGVVHVKASFAERRTDDQPLSHALVQAGYFSPLWTMDCKSGPAEHPVNRGELGSPERNPVDRRSAKRKDIEDEGYFSNCFAYNANTAPSQMPTPSGFRIIRCNFAGPDDPFSAATIAAWQAFKAKQGL